MKVWNWEGFWGYFTNLYLLEGALWTIGLTVSTLILGGMIGLLLAVMRLSKHKALSRTAEVYVWIFRGTPLLVQLVFWYNLSMLFPVISLGIPFGPDLVSWNANDLITPLTAAVTSTAWGAEQSTGISVGWLVAESMPKQVPAGHTFDWSSSATWPLKVIGWLSGPGSCSPHNRCCSDCVPTASPDHKTLIVNLLLGSYRAPR